MELLTSQKKDPSGIKYLYKGAGVYASNYFIYEVSIHKYWKRGYCLLGIKYFKSDKLLSTKSQIKRFKDYFISKEIELLAVPYSFIEENNLQKIIYIKKK